MATAFAARLAVGLREQLDGDEATLGIAARGILHGHLPVAESNFHYNGALEAYLVAPFVAVLGSTTLALRVAMATVGAGYVVAAAWLGRELFGVRRAAPVMAGVAAVMPLFAVTWPEKARWGYAESLLLTTLLLALGVRILWRGGAADLRLWVAAGVVAGLGIWNSLSMLIPGGLLLLCLLVRVDVVGRRRALGGAATALGGLLVAGLPWLIYNLSHNLAGIRRLPDYHTGTLTALRGLLTHVLPVVTGGSGRCDAQTVAPAVSDLALGALLAAVLVVRRGPLLALLRGRLRSLQPVDAVLALLPIEVVPLVVGRFNGLACEPRYAVGLAVPLVVAVTAVVLAASRWWRLPAAAGLCAWLAVSGVTADGRLIDDRDGTTDGVAVPEALGPAIEGLRAAGIGGERLAADYWLARPLAYLSGGDVAPAEMMGGLGDPFDALDGPPQGWVVVDGEPLEQRLVAELRRRGIAHRRVALGGLVLYDRLSAPVPIEALGLHR